MAWASTSARQGLLFLPLVLVVLRPIELACTKDAFNAAKHQILEQNAAIPKPPPKSDEPPASKESEQEKIDKQLWLVGHIGLGTLRVLDDASFWTAIACVIAALRLRTLAVPTSPQRQLGWWSLMAICFLVWMGTYVLRMRETGGSVAWAFDRWPKLPHDWRYWSLASIQFAEGLIKIAAMLALCSACVHGWRSARAMAITPNGVFPADDASKLLTTCIATFPLIFFVLTVFKLMTADIGYKDEPPLLFGIKLVGQLAAAAVPLVLLAIAAVWHWGPARRYTIELGKELVSIKVS